MTYGILYGLVLLSLTLTVPGAFADDAVPFHEKLRIHGDIVDSGGPMLVEIVYDSKSCGFFPAGTMEGFFIFSLDASRMEARCASADAYEAFSYYGGGISSWSLESSSEGMNRFSTAVAFRLVSNMVESLEDSISKSSLELKLEKADGLEHVKKSRLLRDMFMEMVRNDNAILNQIYKDGNAERNRNRVLDDMMSYADDQLAAKKIDRQSYDDIQELYSLALFYNYAHGADERERLIDRIQDRLYGMFATGEPPGALQGITSGINRAGHALSQQATRDIALSYTAGTLDHNVLVATVKLLPQIDYVNSIADDDKLPRKLASEWLRIREAIGEAQDIEGITAHKQDIKRAYQGAVLLKDIKKIESFAGQGHHLSGDIKRIWNSHVHLNKAGFEGIVAEADTIRRFSEILKKIELIDGNYDDLNAEFDDAKAIRQHTMELIGQAAGVRDLDDLEGTLDAHVNMLDGFAEESRRPTPPNLNSSDDPDKQVSKKPIDVARDPKIREEMKKTYRLINSNYIEKAPESVTHVTKLLWHSLEAKAKTTTLITEVPKIIAELKEMNAALKTAKLIEEKYKEKLSGVINPLLLKQRADFDGEMRNANSFAQVSKILVPYGEKLGVLAGVDVSETLDSYTKQYRNLERQAVDNYDTGGLEEIRKILAEIKRFSGKDTRNLSPDDTIRLNELLYRIESSIPEERLKQRIYSAVDHPFKIKQLLQKARAIENLVSVGDGRHRFAAGYEEFAASIKARVELARDSLLVQKDPELADRMLEEALEEWQKVNEEYVEGTHDRFVYDIAEIRKIRYNDLLENMHDLFPTPSQNPMYAEFVELKNKMQETINYGSLGSFEDDLKKLIALLEGEKMRGDIFFDVSYNGTEKLWSIKGAINEPKNKRDSVVFSVHDLQDGNNNHGVFTPVNTRDGNFNTLWEAPKSGTFAIKLDHGNSSAVKIISVSPDLFFEQNKRQAEHADVVELFQNFKNIIANFGGDNYEKNAHKFETITGIVDRSLSKSDTAKAQKYTSVLEKLVERYVPERSKRTIIDSEFSGDQIIVSGAFKKSTLFGAPELVTVSLLDTDGRTIDTRDIQDDGSGYYGVAIQAQKPGFYVLKMVHDGGMVTDVIKIV